MAATSPICRTQPPISIRPSSIRNTRSTGRSPTRRSTATARISTSSASRRTSPARRRRSFGRGRGRSRSTAGRESRSRSTSTNPIAQSRYRGERRLSPSLCRSLEHGDCLRRVSACQNSSRWPSPSARRNVCRCKPSSIRRSPSVRRRLQAIHGLSREGLDDCGSDQRTRLLATGAYGHPMAKQHARRYVWQCRGKYGFKSVKSINHFTFADKQPKTCWEALKASEYGFWANVESGRAASALESGRLKRSSAPAGASRLCCSTATCEFVADRA